ncbi:hypothetical protein BCR44DRAFT_1464282 [Catenaria anguillulae PL171]|uniref:Uncharacterized protein n=1 Tax=Catenaria anguillulae PL171 TaxID=765915 RepID=A0A1Y2H8T4_9FUNG|nr:hypothetical protein BCR44DRAFT_1464282 [Catenaria anguillulae PL171]
MAIRILPGITTTNQVPTDPTVVGATQVHDLYISNAIKRRGYGSSAADTQTAAMLHAVLALWSICPLRFPNASGAVPAAIEDHYRVAAAHPPNSSSFTPDSLRAMFQREHLQLVHHPKQLQLKLKHMSVSLVHKLGIALPHSFTFMHMLSGPTKSLIRVTLSTAHVTVHGDTPSVIPAWIAAPHHLVYLAIRGNEPSTWRSICASARSTSQPPGSMPVDAAKEKYAALRDRRESDTEKWEHDLFGKSVPGQRAKEKKKANRKPKVSKGGKEFDEAEPGHDRRSVERIDWSERRSRSRSRDWADQRHDHRSSTQIELKLQSAPTQESSLQS